MSYPLENALFQWEEGERRLRQAEETAQADLEAAVETVLAELYAEGTDWCLEIALATDSEPGADPRTLADAAFNRYSREAVDYGGGRKHEPF